MVKLFLTMAVGTAGGYFCYKRKLPAGMMTGSIMAAALFSVFTGMAWVPDELRFFSQAVSGAAIGFGLDRDGLRKLPYLAGPLGVLLGGLAAINLAIGFLIFFFSPLDLVTALVGCLPGALSSAPIIAAEMGGDMTQVALLQIIRMSLSILAFPTLLHYMGETEDSASRSEKKITEPHPAGKKADSGIVSCLGMLVLAVVGGKIGDWAGIPGGSIVGAMVLTLFCKLCFPQLSLPVFAKRAAQILAGSYIGGHISRGDLLAVPQLITPIFFLVTGYFAYWIFMGKVMQKLFQFDKRAAFLSVIPAGGGDIALIAADLGVENSDLLVMQVFRMVVVTGVFPQLIALISNMMT